MTNITAQRLDDALAHALGPELRELLAWQNLTDLMLNADGRIWIDVTGVGCYESGLHMGASDAETALKLLASNCGRPLTQQTPILSATMPRSGERIAGTIPPITSKPTFAIRKPPAVAFDLHAYGESTIAPTILCSQHFANLHTKLSAAIEEQRNILFAGSTGSGKTSVLSAALKTDSVMKRRLLIIEDTHEISTEAPNHVRFLSTDHVDTAQLAKLALRYRPDSILVGEVRDGETTIEMLQAMNTGHRGSFGTIHANSAEDALGRLEDLTSKVCYTIPRRAIATAIGCIVFMQRATAGRDIAEVVYVNGFDGTNYLLS